MRKLAVLLTAALALSTAAFDPDHQGAEGEPAGDLYYLTCQGETPFTQADLVTGGSVGSWGEEAPTGSTRNGDGCWSFDTPVEGASNDNSLYDSAWTGLYKGAIEDLALTLYVGSANHCSNFSVLISSGEEVIFDGTAGHDFLITEGGPYIETFRMEATFTGLDLPARTHELTIKVSTTQDPVAVFYGAADAPATIRFNPGMVVGNEIPA